jgi:hypothetical protein
MYFTRRDFLRIGGVLAGSLVLQEILAGCGSSALSTERTATPFSPTSLAAVPTPTEAVPIIEVGGYQIPKGLVEASTSAIAKAFNVKPEVIIGALTPVVKTGADGKQYVVVATGGLTLKSDLNVTVTNAPLLIAEKNEKGEWVWAVSELKSLGEKTGVMIGAAVGDAGNEYLEKVYQDTAGNGYSVLLVNSGFWSTDLADRPKTSAIFTALANRVGDILYVHPGISPPDQGYLVNCRTKEEAIAAIRTRAHEMMKQIDPQKNTRGKPTYVNIENEAFLNFLNEDGKVSFPWNNTKAHDLLGNDVLIEAYLAFYDAATTLNLRVGEDVIFTFSEHGLDTDNPKTNFALKEFARAKKEIAKRLGITEDQVRISIGFQGRYDKKIPTIRRPIFMGLRITEDGIFQENKYWQLPGPYSNLCLMN